MKKMLGYSKHLFRAQGRHGTHSPFVYAFVENVLRSTARLETEEIRKEYDWSRKEINLLARTILFLKPQRIYADEALTGFLNRIIALLNRDDLMVLPLVEEEIMKMQGEGILIISGNSSEQFSLLYAVLEHTPVSLLILRPHAGKDAETFWNRLAGCSGVKMQLDLWYAGVLMNDPAFKARQCFRLR